MNIQASNGVMNLGHQLDNLATVISFPIGDVIADQGAGGSWSVRIQRNGDVAAYPTSNFSISNNNLNLIMTSSDLANVGEGQIQLKYAVGSKVLMSRVYKFYSHYSLDGSGTVPAPWQSWVDAVEADADRAEAAVAHYPYIDSTTKHWMQYNATTEQFVDTGIVAEGQDGEDGADGEDGVSPVATVSKVGKIATITITDATGTTTATVSDGNDGATGPAGQDGQDGEDGFSPSATVSKTGSVATITITDKNGTTTAQVSDGQTQDLTPYRTAAAQDVIDNTLQPKTDNLLSTTSKQVVGAINEIDAMIPAQASAENQLADKEFTNSSIATNTAHYIYKTVGGEKVPFDSVAELEAYSGTVTQNDYAFVQGTDSEGNAYYDRYKADVVGTTHTWAKEYRLNNSSFTAQQWSAITSGITSGLVSLIGTALQPSALTNYVQKTDYAGSTAGIARVNSSYGLQANATGLIYGVPYTYANYSSLQSGGVISKLTLENVLDNETIRIDKTQSLSSAQKSQAYTNLGAVSSQGIPIVTSISASSTNNEVPSAKAVYDYTKMDLLWTNPNQGSSFASQTVSLDLSNYTFVLINCRLGTGNNNRNMNLLIVDGSISQRLTVFSQKLGYRNNVVVSTTGINFGDSYYSDSYGTEAMDNTKYIPIYIYGIR